MSNQSKIVEGLNKIGEGVRILNSGPLEYYLERADEVFTEFFRRCSPFKSGNIVEIVTEIDFTKAHGWAHSAHFLKVGCRGVVKEVDFYKGKFQALVEMRNQTFFTTEGKELPISSPHLYSFSEDQVRTVEEYGEIVVGIPSQNQSKGWGICAYQSKEVKIKLAEC